MKKIPRVVIIGRINVGKSALFNRLSDSRQALVSPRAGTTRDYNQAEVSWRDKKFLLLDTGGVDSNLIHDSLLSLAAKKPQPPLTADQLEMAIVNQTKVALAKADLILLVTDARTGLMPAEKKLALALKKIKLPVIVVCNKVDNQKYRAAVSEFFKLGLGQPAAVSASNGSGTGDLLDLIVKKIKAPAGRPKKIQNSALIKVAIIGKPNVGKSSLVNKILGEPRVIVSPLPQTTREPQDTLIHYHDQAISLIDTAGLRKKAHVEPGLEKQITKKTLAVIEQAEVILLVTEVQTPLTSQDLRLAGLIKEAGAGIIILANKWDLLQEKSEKIGQEMTNYYRRSLPFLQFAPLVFVAAQTGLNVEKILNLTIKVGQERQKKIEKPALMRLITQATQKQSPVQAQGSFRPKIYQLEQTDTAPPEFTITIGQQQSLHFSYLRFLENQLREQFGFSGTPIKLKIKRIKPHRL